jgi:hypothetical protein
MKQILLLMAAVKPEIDIDVTTHHRAWYENPWIIGGLVLAVVLIALIVGAVARSGGSGTTVIRQ